MLKSYSQVLCTIQAADHSSVFCMVPQDLCGTTENVFLKNI